MKEGPGHTFAPTFSHHTHLPARFMMHFKITKGSFELSVLENVVPTMFDNGMRRAWTRLDRGGGGKWVGKPD